MEQTGHFGLGAGKHRKRAMLAEFGVRGTVSARKGAGPATRA